MHTEPANAEAGEGRENSKPASTHHKACSRKQAAVACPPLARACRGPRGAALPWEASAHLTVTTATTTFRFSSTMDHTDTITRI